MTKSHHVTSVSPYPRQCPFTAAITGLKISHPLSNEFVVGFSQKVPPNSPAEPAPSRMSPPAQNARAAAGRVSAAPPASPPPPPAPGAGGGRGRGRGGRVWFPRLTVVAPPGRL